MQQKSLASHSSQAPRITRYIFLTLALMGIVAVAAYAQIMVFVLAAAVALAGLFVFVKKPEWATLIFVFTLFTNTSVVLHKFHGIPHIVAASIIFILIIPAYFFLKEGRKLVLDRTLFLLLIYLSSLIVSTLFAKDALLGIDSIVNFASEGIIIYVLVVNAIRNLSTLRKCMWALLIAGGFMSGITILQELTNTYDNSFGGFAQRKQDIDISSLNLTEYSGLRRAYGPIGEQNRYAQTLVILVPFALGLFFISGKRRYRTLALLMGGSTLGGVLLTFSRSIFLILILLFLLVIYLKYIKLKHVAIGGVLVIVFVSIFLPEYFGRISSILSAPKLFSSHAETRELDGAVRGRYAENIAALRAYIDHPVIGVGPAHFPKFYVRKYGNEVGIKRLEGNRRAHNLYLEIAAEVGTFGILSFMAIVLYVIYKLIVLRKFWQHRDPQNATIATAFMLSLLTYLGTGVFLHLSFQRYYWFLIAISVAAIHILNSEKDDLLQSEEKMI